MNVIIIIVLFLLYLYECKKEFFSPLPADLPFISMNYYSQIAIATTINNPCNLCEKQLIENYKSYSNLQNYALHVYKSDPSLNAQQYLQFKYKIILKLLAMDYKYIIWIDSNTIFNNFTYRLTKMININKESHIILSKDLKRPIFNSEIIIFQNTDWIKNLIEKAINYKINNNFTINQVLEKLVIRDSFISKKRNFNNIHKNINIIDKNNINPFPCKKTINDSLLLDIKELDNKTKVKFITYINEKNMIV